MTTTALALVLAAALLHATWNLLLKRVGGGVPFMWLVAACSSVIYAPVAWWVVVAKQPVIGGIHVAFILGSAIIHAAYFVLLARGYRWGDLSVVYPLARGTGPLIATMAAIVLFGERPSVLAIAGALAIGAGVFLLAGDPRKLARSNNAATVGFALLTGLMIASYTVWDKYAVATLLISPLLFDWGANAGRVLVLAPLVVSQSGTVRQEWRVKWRTIVAIAVLSPLSYILVLFAMQMAPLSYVAPAREVSILFAALMGRHLLGEGRGVQRAIAAVIIMLGLAALALG